MKLQINRGRVKRPQKIALYAPEGLGKSTIGSQLPNPLFIDLEQGTHHLDVARVEPQTLTEVEDLLVALANRKVEGGFRTLVIDTVDWLEELVVKQVYTDAQKKSIEDFGYGKGYVHLAEKFSTVLDKLDRVAAAGMDVVLLAHSQVKKFEQPDDAKAYDRYELKLTKSIGPLVKEWCDALLFANWKTNVRQPDEGRAKGVGGKERKLYATHTAAWDAKNRHGLKDEEPFSVDTFMKILGAGPAPAVISGSVGGGPSSDAGATSLTSSPTPPPSNSAPAPAPAPTAPEPTPAAPPAAAAPSPEAPDHVPGLDTPHEQAAKLLNEHVLTAVQWLTKNGRLQAGQGFADLPTDYVQKILKNPVRFIETITKAA